MRFAESFLTEGVAELQPAPQLDLRLGGMNGFAPVFGEFQNNQAHVRRPLVGLVLTFPKAFEFTSNPEWWGATLKAIMEVHPHQIDGLQSNIEVDFGAETPVGNGGERQQDWTAVTRQPSNPSFMWKDKYGMPIGNFWETYIQMFIGDPDTRVPGIALMEGTGMTDQLSDMYSFTMLFFEPDPTFTTVVRAWLCANMAPRSAGTFEGSKEVGGTMNQVEHTIEFTALTQHGIGPKLLAQSILSNINVINASPQFAPAFLQGISSDVAAASGGYVGKAEEAASNAISTRV
jgi:hypothetical protein